MNEQDERGAKVATKRVDIQALRAHADKGWGDDCLVPKSVIAMIAEELEASRAASTSANVAQNEHPAFRDIASALLHIDVRGVSIGDKAIIQAAIDALNSANVAQGAETVGYYLEYGSGRYDVIPAWATADKNQALLVKQRGSPVYRVAPPAQTALTDDARDAFIRDVAAQKPEKPDHWSSCGQCGHNIERAQDLLDAAQSASGDTQ